MTIKSWRFIALILAALAMGMKLTHALELPPKLLWDAELYLAVQTNLYRLFGTIGPILEIGALLSVSTLASLSRGRHPTFRYTLASSIAVLLSLIVWVAFVMPANAHINQWQATQVIPSDWTRWRNQWQFAQAATFALHFIGFGALVRSVVIETLDK